MNVSRIASALVVVVAVAGCSEPATRRTPIAETSVSGSPLVSSAPVVAPSSRPTASPSGDPGGFAEGTQPSQGPLVFVQVIDWVGSTLVSQDKATFHLTENCAYLHGPPAEPVLLIWPQGLAWVDPAAPSTMHFRDTMTGEVRHLTDGQTVNLGGYSIGGDGYTYQPRPHESCPASGDHFAVQEVR